MWHSKIPKRSSVHLKTPKDPIFGRFWSETHFYFTKHAFFFVATNYTSDWMVVLWVGASSKKHKKFARRFIADIKTQNKTFFWRFFVPKAVFFRKYVFFNVATPCASIYASISWVSASSDSCGKIPKRFTADLKTPKKTILMFFFEPKRLFLPYNCLFYCCNTLCRQLDGFFVSLSINGCTQKNSEVF